MRHEYEFNNFLSPTQESLPFVFIIKLISMLLVNGEIMKKSSRYG